MKILKYTALLFFAITLFSCSSDDDSTPEIPADETSGLQKIQEITNDTHTIELYSATGSLVQGYNHVSLRIKDTKTNAYITDAKIEWTPLMHMKMMEHSCPKSVVAKVSDKKTLYEGNLIFQMAQNETEYWDLSFTYTINTISYTATSKISVPASAKRTVSSFKGTDGTSYVIAYIAPTSPKVAVNDMTVAIYKMQDMMTFSTVDNFKVKIDPRMPSMANHGSPNNTDLLQNTADGFYKGKLSLTMTGYWKINLQVLNATDEVLKGEPVTTENTASSLYFEIEF
ncbi:MULTISPECIES: FixH family protein [Flavobacterium]|uniref:FixH family protein n=1 Tax=Flavobacterium TaxID=237 RepID=UPI0011824555|nr:MULTISPECIES: FixH family protein [Flavobacterium]MCR4033726.1 FixH family protein [Flavobacterium panacis]